MQRKLMLNSKKLISLLVCIMMIAATFPIHSLNNTVFAEGDVRYVNDCKSLKKALISSNATNGGVCEIVLTDDIIIQPNDKIPYMDKSGGFMFSITNPEDEDEHERKILTIKSDGKKIHKIQNLKRDVGLFSVDGQDGLTLNLENIVIDAGAEAEGNGFKSGDPERKVDFIKLHGTHNSTDQSYALEVNFKNGATVQNVNQGLDSSCEGKVINVDASQFNFCGGTIKNCGANKGGAIYLSGGLLNLSSGEISNCKAENGGAIFSYGGLIKDLSKESGGLKIDSCFASDSGGAIYQTLEDAYFDGLKIKNCKAGFAGGAIYGKKSGLTKIDDITIENCSVNDVDETLGSNELLNCGGGAIANDDERQLMIKDCNIANCSTNMNGGAVLNCEGAKLAIYGGKIKNCFITKNSNKIDPENLSKNATKYLGDAICNNSSRGMVIVQAGGDLEIEVSNQAKGNNMPAKICGYEGLFDRTYYETGEMSQDPNFADAKLYDESWGILLTGGEPKIELVSIKLDGDNSENEKVVQDHSVCFTEYHPEDKDDELYYGPTNKGITLKYSIGDKSAEINAQDFAISIDGGNKFYYPFEEKHEKDGVLGVSPMNANDKGANNSREYCVHIGGEGKLDIVAKLSDDPASFSQVFRFWIDMSPPEAPIVTEIDGSELNRDKETTSYTNKGTFYKFKNESETKYFTKEPIHFYGTGEEGCTLEIYKLDDLEDDGTIKEGAQILVSQSIGDFKHLGPPQKETPWEATMDKVKGVLNDSDKVGLVFVQRDKAGNISLKSNVYVGVDMDGPTGKMQFDVLDSWFDKFLTDVTFGLFSSERFNVEVEAGDLGSGIRSVKWLKSDKVFNSEEELKNQFPVDSNSWNEAKMLENSAKTWEEGEVKGSGGTWNFQINKTQNEKFFVYVQLMDMSKNVTYLRSDGAVFYSPMSASDLTYVKKSAQDASSQMALNGNKEIFEKTLDGNKLNESNIQTEYTNDFLKFSLKAAYLDVLEAITHDVAFKYYPFDLTKEKITNKHCTLPSVGFKLNIKKADLQDANIEIKGAKDSYIYGDSPFNVYVKGLPGELEAKFEVENVNGNNVAKINNNGMVTLTGCGQFRIKASTEANADYNAFSTKTQIITVNPCPLAIGGLIYDDREYDATKDLTVKKSGALKLINQSGTNNTVFNLQLNASGNEWVAKFADASIGQNKEARFEENYFKQNFKLTGLEAANCYLVSPTFKANITPRKLKIDPGSIQIKSRNYDGTDKAEFNSVPIFSDDFINSEVNIDKLTIRFADPMPGQNKQVFIDEFKWSLKNNSYNKNNYDLSGISGALIGTADIWVIPVTVNDLPKYINQNTLDIQGTGIPGYEIKITDLENVDISTSQGQIRVDANGNWNATLTNLKDKNNSIKIIQKDPHSDIKSSPVSKSVFVDMFNPIGWVKINNIDIVTKTLYGANIENNRIFDMFYACDLAAKIFAKDEYSGVDNIKYFRSSQFYNSAQQLSNPNIAWTDGASIYNEQISDASASFNIARKEESEKFFIYAKIKDKAGNMIYLRTDGAVIYNEMSVDGNVSYTRCSKDNSNVGVNLHGSNIESIRLKSADGRLDKILQEGPEWVMAVDGTKQLLRFSFGDMDAELEAGNYELEIIYKPGCLLGESEENINMDNLPKKRINLVVSDLNLTDRDFFGDLASQDERIYGDEVNLSNNPHITYVVQRIDGNAEIRERADDSHTRYAKMTRIGKVRIVASYMNIYTKTKTITIKKKLATIANIYAADKEYDKTTDASYYSILDRAKFTPFNRAHSYLENQYDNFSEQEKANFGPKYSYINKKLEVQGLLPEDMKKVDVNGDRVVAKFENCSAGRQKAVNFSGFLLNDVEGYNVAENYEFVQPTREANIEQRAIEFIEIQIANKTFDDKVDADFAKDPIIRGIVQGDRVSITGKPVFANKGPGQNIPVHCGSVTLTGEDASNYTFIWPDVTANIEPAAATGGGGDPIIKPTAGENDFDSDFVNKYDDFSNNKGLASENALAENVMTCLIAFMTISLLATLTVIFIKNKNKQNQSKFY